VMEYSACTTGETEGHVGRWAHSRSVRSTLGSGANYATCGARSVAGESFHDPQGRFVPVRTINQHSREKRAGLSINQTVMTTWRIQLSMERFNKCIESSVKTMSRALKPVYGA
ncbi:hypothetical protein J6590_013906, partial [Homalodisca vitripennis]